MAKNGLDEYDKFRKKFNEDFRKITKSEVKELEQSAADGNRKASRLLKIYNEIVENENIAAVPKDKSRGSLLNSSIRLREFDSETYKKVGSVARGPSFVGSAKERRQERRAKANEYRTDLSFPGATKGYDTELNMAVPTRRPAIAPKEDKARRIGIAPKEGKAQGGMIHRGRQAMRGAD